MLRLAFGPLAGLAFFFLPTLSAAAEITVVTSIKPVQALTAAVMKGAGTPRLIVQGGASPHSTSLRPSAAAALENAQVVVWVGEGLESFLAGPIEALAGKARVVALSELPELTRLAYREGGAWDEHAHEEEHGHEEEHAHEHEDHDHGQGAIDQHFWLDPVNAKVMVAAIAEALTNADPANSGIYRANANIMAYRLEQLTEEITYDLAPVRDVPFVVFHDAFQYFDARFGINNVGSVTVDPDRKPGAARLKEIRANVTELGARCVFAEPQFDSRLIDVVIEGTGARRGTLDPIGAELEDGPEFYFDLMRRITASLKDCLGAQS